MKKTVYIILILAIPVSVNAYAFTKTLQVGNKNEDVLQLQKFLNSNQNTQITDNGLGSKGNETGYFGELTKQAVIKMQNIYADKILKPVGLNIGTGFVGQSTLNFLNSNQSLDNNGTTKDVIVATSGPTVESVNPQEVKDGETITILGKNFSPKNNTVIVGFESKTEYKNIDSTENGTKIEFKYSSSVQKVYDEKYKDISKKTKAKVLEQFPKIPVAVSVIPENGKQSDFKIINFILK